MGAYRYYMTPTQLVQPDEAPESCGLLWIYIGVLRTKKESDFFKQTINAKNYEIGALVKMIRVTKWGAIVVPIGNTEDKY